MSDGRLANSIQYLLKSAIKRLRHAGIEPAEIDARLLLQGASGLAHSRIISDPMLLIDQRIVDRFASHIARRLDNEPVRRILGKREFWGLELEISPAVLDPRPDTERLIEAVLEWVDAHHGREEFLRIADIGTGSGAVTVALLSELSNASAMAVDISAEALAVAKANAHHHDLVHRVEIVEGSYFEPLSGKFDIIVSNPPYVPTMDIAQLAPEVRNYDPIIALDGGSDGLDAYRCLLAESVDWLKVQGAVFLEIGYDQADRVDSVARQFGWERVELLQDIAGNNRILCASH